MSREILESGEVCCYHKHHNININNNINNTSQIEIE